MIRSIRHLGAAARSSLRSSSSLPALHHQHLRFPHPTSRLIFTSRLPDSFDAIDERDDSSIPPSQRGLSQAEFDALPPTEREAVRQAELDLIAAEDSVAASSSRHAEDDGEEEDEGEAGEEGDFDASPSELLASIEEGGKLPESAYESAVPSWVHMQTGNPEFIPPLPGGDPSDPTSIRYPFIPVLTSPRQTAQASVLHRVLQYDRLRSTTHFLHLERRRRLLAYQRQHRDLGPLLDRLRTRLPAPRTDLEGATPAVRNLPSNMSREQLQAVHPHGIPVGLDWVDDLLTLMEGELRMEGRRSTVEKERLLTAAVRHVVWAYRRMMKDKAKGYYRIMNTAPPRDIHVPGEVKTAPPAIRPISSALRMGRVRSKAEAGGPPKP